MECAVKQGSNRKPNADDNSKHREQQPTVDVREQLQVCAHLCAGLCICGYVTSCGKPVINALWVQSIYKMDVVLSLDQLSLNVATWYLIKDTE